MKRIASIVVLLMMIGAGTCLAQIRGTVTGGDGQPAAYASVQLYADSVTSGSPQAFAITDGQGRFDLQAEPSPTAWLVVRCMGNKEYRQKLAGNNLRIQLEADVQTLDEVMVRSTYVPVRVSGDTVSFNTDYFRTGTEESAAEVLQKIPGMEVSESGEVSYAGKTVDKVLVDGKDMFASGSDGALGTLPADAVRGAELLMNYRSGSLIDQFSGRELTALNIKTDGRHRLAGRVSAASGLKSKGRAGASLLYMGTDFSLTSILAANNTGEALFSLEDYIKTVVGLDNILSSNGSGFAPSDEELQMLMPPSNVYRSRAGIATLSGSWQPSQPLRLKGNLMLNGTGLDAETFAQQQYLAYPLLHTRSSDQSSRSLYFTGHLQETWKPSERVEVSNLTQLSHTRLLTADSLAEQGLSDMFANEDDDLRKRSFKEELAVNVKTGERSLLSAHLALNHVRRNYSHALLTDNALLPGVPYTVATDGSLALDTRRRIATFGLAPDVTYALNLSRSLTLVATLDYEHRLSGFTYNGSEVDEAADWNTFGATLALNRKRGLLRFDLAAALKHTLWSTTIGDLADGHSTYLQPSATLTLAFSDMHRLSLSASMKRNPIELEYLLRDTLVSGYSSLLAGSDITDPFARTTDLQLNYHIFDLFTNTMFFAVAGMSDSRFTVRPHSVQDSSIASLTRYDNDGSLRMHFLNLSLSKGLGDWPVDLRLGTNLTQSETSTSVNGADDEMRSLTYGGRLALVSHRKAVLNFDLGGDLNVQRSDFSVAGNRLWQAGGHAALLVAWKRLSGEVRLDYSHVEGDSYSRDFFDLGFRAEYKMKRWRLQLRGGNVLHLDSYEWLASTATPLYLSTATYRRLPGYLLAGVVYHF